MNWQLSVFGLLALVLVGGFVWFERSRPPARLIAAVAALAALGVAGRVALAPVPNVVATTDIVLLAGYTLGGAPGFIVGALSALVSNFWLGQGPWTPWQMAGWGAVGIAGAGLATLFARGLGRWGLALAAAAAALLFGALMDLSTMVNFGGEQSLDRYLALSARGIPFNLAHAAGNAALMLIAGPALVRMLERYRSRFQARWLSREEFAVAGGRPAAEPAATSAIAVLLIVLGLAAGSSGFTGGVDRAAAAPEAATSSAADGRAWLGRVQNRDGGWGNAPGVSSSASMTAWATLGLEAAGRNPLDVRARGGKTPIDYLRRNSGAIDSNGDIELAILALEAAGIDSRSFAGRDLPGELIGRRRKDGSLEGQVNQTAYAVLALRAAGLDGSTLGKSAAWLRRAQNRDGGWGSVPKARSEADSTGATLQALAVAPGGGGELAEGARWLSSKQRSDGSWALTQGAAGNSQSTAWAVQGLRAAGRDPSSVRSGGSSPLQYLAARQASDGHYRYSTGSDQTPVWVTAQALTGVEVAPFPLSRVARKPRSGGAGSGGGASGGGPGSAGSASGGGFGAGAGSFKGSGERGNLRSGSFGGGGGRSAAGGGPGGSLGPLAPDGTEALEQVGADQLAATGDPAGDEGLEAPSTPVLLGSLAVVAALLAGGFFLYRRRLP